MIAELILAAGSSFGLSVVLKSTVLLASGLIVVAACRRTRAAVRHVALAATFGALLMLPVASAIGPVVEVPVDARAAGPARTTGRGGPAAHRSPASPVPIAEVFADGWSLPRVVHALQNWSRIDWSPGSAASIWLGYGGGALLLLASLAARMWRTRRLLRRGVPCLALEDLVESLSGQAGLTRSVAVVTHEAVRSPLTFGILHPSIVVPADIGTWSARNVTRALVHELEHIRRHDSALQIGARVVCAMYWFNPLVWIAWRTLCLDAERACDDAVVLNDASADYAEQLVLLARRCSSAAPVTLGMARRSDLSARVSALLDGGRRRGPAGLAVTGVAVGAAALLLFVVSPLHAVTARHDLGNGIVSGQLPPEPTTPQDRALYRAAERGDLERMARLVQAGASVDAALEGDGSALIAAARAGTLASVAWLLDRGADPNLGVSGDGSPLIMAAREGHGDIVALLLNRGARVDQVVDGDENALIQASAKGHLPVVRLLVDRGADVNARVWAEGADGSNGEWRTPLGMARKGGHASVVTFLLAAGAR